MEIRKIISEELGAFFGSDEENEASLRKIVREEVGAILGVHSLSSVRWPYSISAPPPEDLVFTDPATCRHPDPPWTNTE
jgi:hypothetical protein